MADNTEQERQSPPPQTRGESRGGTRGDTRGRSSKQPRSAASQKGRANKIYRTPPTPDQGDLLVKVCIFVVVVIVAAAVATIAVANENLC